MSDLASNVFFLRLIYSLPHLQVLALVLTIVIELYLKCYARVEINQTAIGRKGSQRH
jgi:hypothetical protein